MGVADSFGYAYAKAQISAGNNLPKAGVVFMSVNERDKRYVSALSRDFQALGFQLWPPAERRLSLPRQAWKSRVSTRSTKADPMSSTSSRATRSTWWSTPPWAGSPSLTRRRYDAPAPSTALPVLRLSQPPPLPSALFERCKEKKSRSKACRNITVFRSRLEKKVTGLRLQVPQPSVRTCDLRPAT